MKNKEYQENCNLERKKRGYCDGRCVFHSSIPEQICLTHQGVQAIVLTIVAGQDVLKKKSKKEVR